MHQRQARRCIADRDANRNSVVHLVDISVGFIRTELKRHHIVMDRRESKWDGPSDRSGGRVSRREELIFAAASLFAEEGFHQTSMERLAEHVGLAKPTLYHYFKSKEEILFEIHLHFIEPLIKSQLRRVELGMDPSQMLLEYIVDHLEALRDKPGLLQLFFEHRRELGSARQVEARENRRRYRLLIEDIIRAGITSGQFREVDVRLTTFALFGMVNWASKWYRLEKQLNPREAGYILWDQFWRGLQNTS